ncbi:peptide chain release factor H [Entomomonas asaccharolytica]|uniref:Peptide chain release factor H n=1 Tax=Entomomonas asaccharolytica TaxID=2785331 RepID=A0A974NF07_9GAMM|nr:peptide chain release factor H [Entomomonas asaccharolytica]QQP85379.1 peptide chain release factor H [Entomomonas asaccharolytica]
MLLLQLSSAQGPEECCLAVAKALQKLHKEAEQAKVKLTIIEQEKGRNANTLRSVLVTLDGEQEQFIAEQWVGSIQWICQSPYRPNHGRKNWFIGVACFNTPHVASDGEIKFETMRASGAGGQHVNKTDSAVRATHLATGITVKVQSERSQHANKRLALLLISQKLAKKKQLIEGEHKAERRLFHHHIERGNAKRIFKGIDFI